MPSNAVVSTKDIDTFGQNVDVECIVCIGLVHVVQSPESVFTAFFPVIVSVILKETHDLSDAFECLRFVDIFYGLELFDELFFVAKDQLVHQDAFILQSFEKHI